MDTTSLRILNSDKLSRDEYKQETKNYLHYIKEENKTNDDERRFNIKKLLVKLYDDLSKNIESNQESTGAINDDPIEGILAIADTCIEEQNDKRKNPNITINLENDLNYILNDRENGELCEEDNYKARVNAFYSLCTKHRRIKEYPQFRELVNTRENDVDKDEIFKIMYAYSLIQEAAMGFDPTKALECWKNKISPIYKRLPAFTQIYTETVVLIYETSEKQVPELLKESEGLIENAISMREYPKFYSTRGRIRCCKGQYEDGVNDVRKAIELEDHGRKDYWSRINEYEALISRFQRKKDEKELKEQANKIQAELEKSKTDYIGILGFFCSVMAFIIGFVNNAGGKESIADSLQLLMAIAGMIIMSFGSLNLILVRKEKDENKTNKYSEWTLLLIGGFVFFLSFGVKMLYKYLETNNLI